MNYRLVVIAFLIFITSHAQNIGVGISGIYNFQTESVGMGVRAKLYPDKRLSFVPQVSYYFSFNKVEEFLIGLGVEYKFFHYKKYSFYALGHGAYNSWFNYANSAKTDAQLNNWNGELGLGITTNKCLRPFIEYRYNFKFYETHLQLGLLYIFGCKSKRKRAVDECPAYSLK